MSRIKSEAENTVETVVLQHLQYRRREQEGLKWKICEIFSMKNLCTVEVLLICRNYSDERIESIRRANADRSKA